MRTLSTTQFLPLGIRTRRSALSHDVKRNFASMMELLPIRSILSSSFPRFRYFNMFFLLYIDSTANGDTRKSLPGQTSGPLIADWAKSVFPPSSASSFRIMGFPWSSRLDVWREISQSPSRVLLLLLHPLSGLFSGGALTFSSCGGLRFLFGEKERRRRWRRSGKGGGGNGSGREGEGGGGGTAPGESFLLQIAGGGPLEEIRPPIHMQMPLDLLREGGAGLSRRWKGKGT